MTVTLDYERYLKRPKRRACMRRALRLVYALSNWLFEIDKRVGLCVYVTLVVFLLESRGLSLNSGRLWQIVHFYDRRKILFRYRF